MIKEAINRILELSAPNYKEIGDRIYSDKSMKLIAPPHVSTLSFNTLKGFINTIINEIEEDERLIISVANPKQVTAYSSVGPVDMIREEPYNAIADVKEFSFGQFMDYEMMMISLKSRFVQTAALNNLIALLGTITEENNAAVSDDGFKQTVTVRKGVALKENADVNPIVKLKPYRTFIEVNQPESEFIVRLQAGGKVALFEADGGAWKLEARENIAEFLRFELQLLIDKGNVIVVE